jgi:hypothetical protein
MAASVQRAVERRPSAKLPGFAIEELETRLEMATCCNNCVCNAHDQWGNCTNYICTGCHPC